MSSLSLFIKSVFHNTSVQMILHFFRYKYFSLPLSFLSLVSNPDPFFDRSKQITDYSNLQIKQIYGNINGIITIIQRHESRKSLISNTMCFMKINRQWKSFMLWCILFVHADFATVVLGVSLSFESKDQNSKLGLCFTQTRKCWDQDSSSSSVAYLSNTEFFESLPTW